MPPRPSSRSIPQVPSRSPIMACIRKACAWAHRGPRSVQHIPSVRRFPYTNSRKRSEGGGMRTALLLIAHGSRQDEANADLYHVVAEMRLRGGYDPVEASFLELAEPGIDEGAARCVAAGAERVVLLPDFLSAGGGVGRQLAEARRRLAARFPQVDFRLAEPLGPHRLLIEIVAQRASQAVGEGEREG